MKKPTDEEVCRAVKDQTIADNRMTEHYPRWIEAEKKKDKKVKKRKMKQMSFEDFG